MLGAFVLGGFVGALLTYVWLDREGLVDRLSSFRDTASEHAPTSEQTASAASTTWSIVRRYWLVLLIVFVLAFWGISVLISQATATPTVSTGLIQLEDKCGVTLNVNLTDEDVRRGNVTFGSTEDCRRTVNLQPAQ